METSEQGSADVVCKLLRHDKRYVILKRFRDTVWREYGMWGTDKPQSTSNAYKAINEGKKNALTPEDAAKADFIRERDRFVDEGYQAVDFDEKTWTPDLTVKGFTLDLTNPPKSFCVSKPKTEIADKALDKMIKDGRALCQVKENGLCHWIFKTADPAGGPSIVRIFTRRMDEVTSKYLALGSYVRSDLYIPEGTILAVELIVPGEGHQLQRFKRMCSISRSDVVKGVCKPDQSATHALINETPVQAVVFHAPYWGGEAAGVYSEVWARIEPFHHRLLRGPEQIGPIKSAAAATAWIDAHKDECEGMVIWDLQDCIEISFTGKPKRRNAYKRKPVREADVIATGWEEGTGKRQGKIGALLISQAHPETGEMVFCGKVASGLTDESSELSYWEFPTAIQIEYAERFEETGKFQHPRLVGKHPDKQPAECIYDVEE